MNKESLISILEIKETDTVFVDVINNIYHVSFPPEERRDFDKFLELMNENDYFKVFVILKDENPVGFITIWDFSDFAYVEHFATAPEARGGGIGNKVMHLIVKHLNKPIILEVEPPTDEFSQRRINFYNRCGFSLIDTIEYFQPPYRESDQPLKLFLMSHGDIDIDDSHIKTIHKNVYGVK